MGHFRWICSYTTRIPSARAVSQHGGIQRVRDVSFGPRGSRLARRRLREFKNN